MMAEKIAKQLLQKGVKPMTVAPDAFHLVSLACCLLSRGLSCGVTFIIVGPLFVAHAASRRMSVVGLTGSVRGADGPGKQISLSRINKEVKAAEPK